MEMLLLLLVPLAFGTLFLGGGDDDDATQPPDTDPSTGAVNGTADDDVLRGASGDNAINGVGGDDLIFGYRGDDTLSGGEGRDLLDGGLDDDILIGGNGADALVGGAGNDNLQGGQGVDLLVDGAGDDTLVGGVGNDVLLGSTGADQLYGGAGDDVLDAVSRTADRSLAEDLQNLQLEFAEALRTKYGDDVTEADIDRFLSDIISEEGEHAADALYGGAGEDALAGDNGDTLTGGEGEDLFALTWVDGNAAVEITDYDTIAGESIRIIIDNAPDDFPQLGYRDALDGTSTEILLDDAVIATLSGISADDLAIGALTLQNTDGFGISNSAIRLT